MATMKFLILFFFCFFKFFLLHADSHWRTGVIGEDAEVFC